MPQSTINVRVAPSGQGLTFESFSGDGSINPIAGFGGLNETQTLSLSGAKPSTSTFTLTLGGQTTAPIPWKRVPPSTAFTYNVALPSSGTYDIQAAVPVYYSSNINNYTMYEGVLPLGPPVPIDNAGTTAAYTAADGSIFQAVGRYAFVGTQAIVEVSAAHGVEMGMNAIRLVPVAGGGPPFIVPSTDPSCTAYQQDQTLPLSSVRRSNVHHGGYGDTYATLVAYGNTPTDFPTSWYADPAAVQSAINALPGFAGAATASSSFAVAAGPFANPTTPPPPQVINLAFAGPKVGQAIGPFTSPAPQVTSAVVHPGNTPITYSINGGPKLGLGTTSATFQGVSAQGYFYVPFPQSDPITGTVGGVSVSTAGNFSGTTISGFGLHNPTFSGYSPLLGYGIAGSPMALSLEGLPAATYKVEITWPAVDPTALAAFNFGGPSSQVTLSVADKSGAVLHTEVVDQTVASTGVADPAKPASHWHTLGSFTVAAVENRLRVGIANNLGSTLAIADAVRLTRTSPDVSVTLGVSDIVTINAPAGAFITYAGDSAAMVGQQAIRTPLQPDPSTITPTMAAGWNASSESSYTVNLAHANLVKRIDVSLGYDHVAATDVNGYPTLLSADAYLGKSGNGHGSSTYTMVGQVGTKIVLNDPTGTWSLWYDDTSGGHAPAPDLVGNYGIPWTEVVLPGTITGQATGNRRFYRGIYDPQSACPTLALTIYGNTRNGDGTWPVTVKNIQVYRPKDDGSAEDNPPVWDRSLTSRIGIGPIRCLDLTGAAQSNTPNLASAAQPGDFCITMGGGSGAAITSIANDPNADNFFNPLIGPVARVTTATPHGFVDMTNASPSGPLGNSGVTATRTTMDQATLNTLFNPADPYWQNILDTGGWYVHRIDATNFSFQVDINRGLYPGVSWSLANTLHPTGVSCGTGWSKAVPYQDIVALGIEAGQDLWIPIPSLLDDASVTQIATMCLVSPHKVYVELSNEIWNTGVLENRKFVHWSFSMGLSTAAYDSTPSYVTRAGHCHDLFAAVFNAAGRGSDLVRVIAGQQGNPSTTQGYAAYAHAHGIRVDEMAIAPYVDAGPPDVAGGMPQATLDRFNIYTDEQQLDLLSLLIEYVGVRESFLQHQAGIDGTGLRTASGATVSMVAYEGGWATVIPGISDGSPNVLASRADARTSTILNNPRMYRLGRRMLELAQAGGCKRWQEYKFGDLTGTTTWSKVRGTFQTFGTGAAADLILSDPAAVKNEIAGAYRDWAKAALSNKPRKASIPFQYFFQLAGGF